MSVSQSLTIKQKSQSVSENKTTVTIKLTSTQSGASYNNYTLTGYYWTSVNGGTETKHSFTTTLPSNTTKTCFSVDYTFSHKADGTGSISVRTSLNTKISAGTVTKSASLTPTRIPRATTPTLSATTTEMNKSVTINCPRASSSFTHTLKYTFGSGSGTIGTGIGTSKSWTVPLSLANQIPNATSGSGTITCDTYNGSTKIGTKSITFKTTVPSTVVPTISSVTLSDPKGYLSTFGGYVQNKSQLKVQVASSGAYSSTIKSVSITAFGITGATNPYTFTSITSSGTKSVSVKVTDTRGRTATTSKAFTVLSYSNPTISKLSASRCNSDGSPNDEGAYIKINYECSILTLNNSNSKNILLRYKPQTSSSWTNLLNVSEYSRNTYIISQADINNAYDVSLKLTDSFGSVEKIWKVSTAFTLMDFNESGKGVAIGKVSQGDFFEVNMPLETTSTINSTHTDIAFNQSRAGGGAVGFGVGVGGTNRGIYDYTRNDWMIYRNSLIANTNVVNGDTNFNGNISSKGVEIGTRYNLGNNTLAPDVSVASDSSWHNVMTIKIPNGGVWMLSACAYFQSNANGRRGVRLAVKNNDGTYDGYGIIAVDYQNAVNGAATICQFCFPIYISNETYYLQVVQNSGSALSVSPRFYSAFLCS